MKPLILTLIVILTLKAFAQNAIEGEVRFKDDNSVLPGVNVIEKGTYNGAISNRDGKFIINCKSPHPILEFSFIGLNTIEVAGDKNYLIVYLETDEEHAKEKVRFGIYPRYTSIGFNSGFFYTPVGVDIGNSLPTLFGLRMLTRTTITYRTDLDNNNLLDVRLKRDKLINTNYFGRHFNIVLGYNKREISRNPDGWNTEELNIIPEFVFDQFLFRFGYGRQAVNKVETLKSNQGLIFGLGKYFSWDVSVIGTAKKWNNYWQTEVQFTKAFRKNDFEFGVRFETLDNYRELDLLVLYRIHY